jgi:phosphoheptose isomerase
MGHAEQHAALVARVAGHFAESAKLKLDALLGLADPIARAGALMAQALRGGAKALACGNGGSAADAQHFAAELVNRFETERAPLAGIALTTDSSTLTSIANDYATGRCSPSRCAPSAAAATCCSPSPPAAIPPTCSRR